MAESLDEGLVQKSSRGVDKTEDACIKFEVIEGRVNYDKNAAEEDFQSLEYEEDCFYTLAASNPTPSFDEVSDDDEENVYWSLDSEFYSELQLSDGSDGESSVPTISKPQLLIIRSGNLVRRVRLGLQDWSQRKKKYKRILAIIKQRMASKKGEDPSLTLSPDEADMQSLTEEEKERQREVWQKELAKVEEEIETLRSVLKSKMRLSQQLKKNLGFTVWREISDDLSQGVKTVKETAVYQSVEEGLSNLSKAVVESPAYHNVEDKITLVGKVVSENPVYQRTESVVKMTAESTRSMLGGLTGGFTQKLGQIKNSESFRSLEDKVGSAYENVKTKVSSRSSSMQSFDDALREETARQAASSEKIYSPTIPEGKPLS